MNSKRVFWLMIAGFAASFVLLIGAVFFGDRLLRSKGSDLTALKLEERVMESQQTSLTQAKKDIQKYAELEKIAQSIVPQDKDQAKTVREIVNLAQKNKIPLSSIAFPSSTLGQAATKPAATSSGSSTTTTPTAPATPSITQVKPVEGIQGVYQMEITIQSDTQSPVPYSSLINFLSELEKNRRTAQVSTISIKPDGKDIRLVSFVLAVNVYIKP